MTHRTALTRALAAALLITATPALAACQATNPVTSQMSYEAGDGVSAHSGKVDVRNMVIVGNAKGSPAVLSASVANNGDEEAKIAFVVGDEDPLMVTVPAHGFVVVGSQGTGESSAPGQIASLPVEPGHLVDVEVRSPLGGETVKVPTHPSNGIYATITPTSSTKSATATATETATSTETSTSTGTATSTASASEATGTATTSTTPASTTAATTTAG